MSDLKQIFSNLTLASRKWLHYLDIYDELFKPLKNKHVNILEIGIAQGGSLEMWDKYFSDCHIVGVDIRDKLQNKFKDKDNINVYIGDQSSVDFWDKVVWDESKFDIVIDDGSHNCSDQIITFEKLFKFVNDDGLYIIEDVQTSYMKEHHQSCGYGNPANLISYLFNLYSLFYCQYHKSGKETEISERIEYIQFYENIIIIKKGDRSKVRPIKSNEKWTK